MSDPAVAHSVEVNHAPLNRVFKVDGPIWTFYDRPEERTKQHRFGIAIQGVAGLEPPDNILKGFEWSTLPTNALIVDVGGGVGTASLALAKNLPHIKIVVQDLPDVVKNAVSVWEKELPRAIDSRRVVLQAHDFFTDQPIKNASVFLLKHVLHDWPDAYASKILKKLREVARPETKLILVDNLISFACRDPSCENSKGIPGAVPKEAQKPLLANYGIVNEMEYNVDLTMLALCNSQERAVKQFDELLSNAGWRLTRVIRNVSRGFLQTLEAVPT